MTEMPMFGGTHSSKNTPSLTIRVARITPATRVPRPDDPTPRIPPRIPPLHLLTGKQTIGELAANTGSKSMWMAKERIQNRETGGIFKVPAAPANETNHAADADVFGSVNYPKSKTRAVDEEIGDIEKENKSIIKKFAGRHLDAVGISKSHPEFKELFEIVYRGTAFAIRAHA
ncbi:uncharacterized protein EDB91DRAFT_1254126 [Suillus paluster]|uniref:uncharacterized protein n=1 Tax=Suillus paluster TaxID=48578 RepID=UPI001B86E1AF|nr:uncharacterized protein EDB91DRAFT_1254126 [Suillus paluster]KAG1726882.1 hypothetical protein EDB91DRAFT_1254126 [Suillus paluster]